MGMSKLCILRSDLREQSDLGLYYLQFHLHLLNTLKNVFKRALKNQLSNFRTVTVIIFSVPGFWVILTLAYFLYLFFSGVITYPLLCNAGPY